MKEKPIVIVTAGCSMSSFTIKTIFNLLKLHKYDIYFPEKTELYKFDKNPFYKEGMNLVNMLKKTFEEIPNVIMKMDVRSLETDGIIKILENQKARVCFLNRDNLLDVAICCTKDFIKKSKKRESLQTFKEWRYSDARAKEKIDPSDLISLIERRLTLNSRKMEIMQRIGKVCNNQEKFISAQKLCNFDVHEYEKVFKVLGYNFNKELATKYFSDFETRDQYKHKDVIQQEKIDDFKSELKKYGFLKYWRD